MANYGFKPKGATQPQPKPRYKRRPQNDDERRYAAAARYQKKTETYKQATRVLTEEEKRRTAAEKEGLREQAYTKLRKDRKKGRKYIHKKASERQEAGYKARKDLQDTRIENQQALTTARTVQQNRGISARREATVSRRRYAAATSAANIIPSGGGAPTPISAPRVSFAGGIARLIGMAFGLIVLYAILTHADSSAGAIGKIGSVVVKTSDKQPLFTQVG